MSSIVRPLTQRPAAAPQPPVRRRHRCAAAEGAAPSARDAEPPASHAFGVYVFGGGEGVRGALVDTASGEFVGEGCSTPLALSSPEDLCAAVVKLLTSAKWTGPVGVAMPGRVQDFGRADWAAGRASRAALERLLEAASGCPTVCMGGAEAAGFAELAFGQSAADSAGLVLFASVGAAGFEAALFDEGVLVHGLDLRSVLESWSAGGAPPPPGEHASAPQLAAWAERVDRVLLQLESLLRPSRVVLGGSCVRAAGLPRLLPLLTAGERAPGGLVGASLSLPGTVKGAAWGAVCELRTRRALGAARRALGASVAASAASAAGASSLSPAQLRPVFDQFAGPEGRLTLEQLGAMLRALALPLPAPELRRAAAELAGGGGWAAGVSWPAMEAWWARNVQAEGVELLLSADGLRRALREESGERGRPLCLEVGMTFCRPCKAFERAYKHVAADYPTVRFARINGNENRSCTALARDVLGVRSTPAFYFFRPGEEAPSAQHSGANEARLREALDRLLSAGAGAGAEAEAEAAAAAPPPPAGLDTRGAVESGLAELLGQMGKQRGEVDRLRQALRAAEAELEQMQARLEAATGTSKRTPL